MNPGKKTTQKNICRLFKTLFVALFFAGLGACGSRPGEVKQKLQSKMPVDQLEESDDQSSSKAFNAILVSPKNPRPGEVFHVLVVGGRDIQKTKLLVNTPQGVLEPTQSRSGEGLPFWRIEEFKASTKGKFLVALRSGSTTTGYLDFTVTEKPANPTGNTVWKTTKGWDAAFEALYSAWVNALFYDADERSS